MIASRSCPFQCTFCFHTVGNRYRQRSIESFFKELDYMVGRYDIGYICLADELFSHKTERMKDFCERMKNYGINWWAQFRVSDITPEILPVLKAGGCDVMSFGLESADNRILKSMRKGTTVEQIERTLKLVYDAGISLEGAFIFGDIEETWETATNTLTWWREHAEYKINLNVITVYPGSYLYKYACEKGIIGDKVQFLKDGCPQVRVSKLSDAEYGLLLRTIMEAPMTLAKVISGVEVSAIDFETGRIDIAGTCTVCRQRSAWKNVKLFTTNFLGCDHCGQRYNTTVPPELRANIDANIGRLVERYGAIALWGVNYHVADLVRHSEVLRGGNVRVIDISSSKQQMDLYGKKVEGPAAVEDGKVGAVVIAIPVYFAQIQGQIAANHPNVKAVFDICRLVGPRLPEGGEHR
jgi:anaerobic magnesium-protoporphyrin IX monomethyl ester cyclase